MSWWGNNDKEEQEVKREKLKPICPYCQAVIDKVYYTTVDMIDLEYDPKGENPREADVACCPNCRKILGVEA
jgi:uncharacterized protein with PIN domain